MKKFTSYLFAVAALATAFTFQSCTKSSDDTVTVSTPPSVGTITAGAITSGSTVSVGSVVTLSFKAHAPAGLTKVDVKNGSVSLPGYPKTTTDTTTAYTAVDTLSGFGENNTYKVVVTDKNNKADSASFVVKSGGYKASVLLKGNGASKLILYSISLDSAYTDTAALKSSSLKDAIDFVYFHSNANLTDPGAVISGPSDVNNASNYPAAAALFGTKKTVFVKVPTTSSFTFDNATVASITAALGTSSVTRVTQLAVNDVVVFQTGGGKYGTFRVLSVSNADNKGDFTFSLKHN